MISIKTYMLIGAIFLLTPKNFVESNNYDKQCQDTKVLSLIDADEHGERLIIHGKVIDAETGKPIKANLFFYQADANGNYNSTFFGMPSYAKIRGEITTDANGCFSVLTIVPGNYPGQIDGKHIHAIAKTKGFQKWEFEFLFEGWISPNLREEIKTNNDAIILNLQNKEANKWSVNTEVKLRPK